MNNQQNSSMTPYTFDLPDNTIHITQYRGDPIDLYYTPDDGHFYKVINGRLIKKILNKPLDSTLYKRLNINTTDASTSSTSLTTADNSISILLHCLRS